MPIRFLIISFFAYSSLLAIVPTITVREFNQSKDIKQVQQLIKKEWSKLFLLPAYDEAMMQKMFVHFIPGDTSASRAKLSIKVLNIDGSFAGFITYFMKSQTIGQIELLSITPEQRNKGLGKLLIKHVTDQLKLQGCTYLQLYVYTNNPDALTFYHHLGFKLKTNFGHYQLLGLQI